MLSVIYQKSVWRKLEEIFLEALECDKLYPILKKKFTINWENFNCGKGNKGTLPTSTFLQTTHSEEPIVYKKIFEMLIEVSIFRL